MIMILISMTILTVDPIAIIIIDF